MNKAATPPLACSLNDDAFKERRALARREILPLVDHWSRGEAGLSIQFKDRPGTRDWVELFVSLERQCCGFLDFDVSAESPVRLVISGPDEASDTLAMFEAGLKSA